MRGCERVTSCLAYVRVCPRLPFDFQSIFDARASAGRMSEDEAKPD